MPDRLVVIAGPTAVGKTALAITLAKKLKTEIINADSRQIYREMRVGTAIPSTEQLAAVRHHFIGHRSIHEPYNASRFEQEVLELLDRIFVSHETVIMSGGSGMYIDAVCKGIDNIPSVDLAVRERIQGEYRSNGLALLQARLKDVDPDYFRKVDLNNPQRIMKALEIFEMTGNTYSSFLTGKPKQRNFSVVKIGLNIPRSILHERINARIDQMIAADLLQEVEALYPFRHLNSLNTVGYKELFAYLDGTCSFEDAVEAVKGHTRQYARRQLTWFRKDKEIQWFNSDETEAIEAYILKGLENE